MFSVDAASSRREIGGVGCSVRWRNGTLLGGEGNAIVLAAEKSGLVFAQRVCVALRVGRPHQRQGPVFAPLVDLDHVLP